MEILSTLTTVFLFVTSGFFAIRLRLFHYIRPLRCLRGALSCPKGMDADTDMPSLPPSNGAKRNLEGCTGGEKKRKKARKTQGISPLRGLCMALAGTLGVGNIVGVASALFLGGAGAVFWMVVSGLMVSVLKYAEIVLAVRHRRMTSDGHPAGGAHYYISDLLTDRGYPGAGRVLAAIFGVLCLINALTMGSVLQMNAAAGAMAHLTDAGARGFVGLPPLVTGGVAAFLCAVVMVGGSRRIAAMTERLVPIMTGVYLLLCVSVMVLRRERLPEAVSLIVREALGDLTSGSLRSLGAGLWGMLTSRALRSGVMRGLVSNEAGCGTAPMAHAAAHTVSPAAQGVMGILEVLVDTVLMCTVTALAMLVSDSGMAPFGEDGVSNARAAFTSVLGSWAGVVFGLCILLFALATVFCWAHYGQTALSGLCETLGHPAARGKAGKGFLLLFCASLVFGSVAAPSLAWDMADLAIGLMTLLNLCFLLMGQREIAEETRRFSSESGRDDDSSREREKPS